MVLRNALLIVLLTAQGIYAQEADDSFRIEERPMPPVRFEPATRHMYHVNNAVTLPIIGVLGGGSIYGMTIIYSKKPTPVADIQALDKNNVPSYDRFSAGWHNANLDQISYYPFYAVMPLPLVLLADSRMRGDRGRIGLMYLEAFSVEGILYVGSVYFADRFRPDVYNTDLDLNYRTNGNFRNSFFAGHVAVVALSTFFISKVYDDYHPNSSFKWVLYGASAAATVGMGYIRLEAGKHFLSDIVVGAAVGTACGLLVPVIHKNKGYRDQRWSLMPSMSDRGGTGFTFTYNLR